jgi:hypothetical protein
MRSERTPHTAFESRLANLCQEHLAIVKKNRPSLKKREPVLNFLTPALADKSFPTEIATKQGP